MTKDQSIKILSQAFDNINSIPKIENLRLVLIEPRFLLRDTGISARVLSHWKKSSLLKSTESEFLSWTRFSFIDYILLKIIQQLRMFGVPLKTIGSISSTLCASQLSKISHQEFNKIISKFKSYLKDPGFTDAERNALDEMSARPDALFNLVEHSPIILNSLVANVIIKRQEAGFFLFHDGSIRIFLEEEKGKNPVETFFYYSHLYISITELIWQFLSDTTKEKFISKYNLLTDAEVEVLRKMREKKYKEIIIRFPRKSHKEEITIITKKKIGLSKEDERKVCEILGLKNYQSIEIKSNGKNDVYFEKTHLKNIE